MTQPSGSCCNAGTRPKEEKAMSCPDLTMRRLALASVAAVAAVALAGTAAAQSMAVRSTGPSASKYPAGARLKASDRLTLAAGDRIVLIQAGKTRTLSGPGTFSASGSVQSSQTMVKIGRANV